ncbi:endonuclease domain-containing protein [Phenylobacterium sp.]|uniref:endonuclease domain-containing protein n=1 Tax=Phenylobacterium sp. TaxID=1871053 RepID=UPI0037C5EB40
MVVTFLPPPFTGEGDRAPQRVWWRGRAPHCMRSSILTSKRAKSLRRNLTEPEIMLWVRLRRRSPDYPVFRNQHPLGPYILDFYCPKAKLAVEIDGAGHFEKAQIEHDERRDAWLNRQGVTVFRVTASAVFEDAGNVADGVRRMADELIAVRGAAPSTTPFVRGPPPPLRVGGRS